MDPFREENTLIRPETSSSLDGKGYDRRPALVPRRAEAY